MNVPDRYRLSVTGLVVMALLAWTGQSRAGVVVELVDDVFAGPGSSNPFALAALGSSVLFMADDFVHGSELWKTDGTTAGTTLVKDIFAGVSPSGLGPFTVLGDTIIFSAIDAANGGELWRTDGTSAGTTLVKDIAPGPNTGSFPYNFAALGGKVLFSADDGIRGYELWTTDGTTTGTTLVADIGINDPVSGFESSFPTDLTVFDGAVYFSADDGNHGNELWKTDGTATGTTLVADIATGDPGLGLESSFPGDFTVFNGELYFSAFEPTTGIELWKTDGTASGTTLVADIATGGTPGLDSSFPTGLTAFNGALYFSAYTPVHGLEIWKTDGTPAGTTLVRDIDAGTGDSTPGGFTTFGGALYFSAFEPTTGIELWKTDGTEAGTTLVKDIHAGIAGSLPSDFTIFGGELYFAADNGVDGVELWKSDGTTIGTVLVADIFSGAGDSFPGEFTSLGEDMFFSAGDPTHGRELWRMQVKAGAPMVPEPTALALLVLGLSIVGLSRRGLKA